MSDLLSLGIEQITDICDKGLTAYGINPVVHSLIIDGVFAGVGSVLSFAGYCGVIFLFIHFRRFRLYGKDCICNGQAVTKDRTFREEFCADADRIRMYRAGSYGNEDTFF